jgi:two-component system CheB/CheR fusion protein
MDTNKQKPVIIAVGASAGGLEALQDFLGNFPLELKNVCIIIAQHLSPTHKSMLVQLLSRETKLTVEEAADGRPLEAGKVYITPPDSEISVSEYHLRLRRPLAGVGPKPSVDVLFQSLADNHPDKCIAVVLSGTGSDGALGVRAVKKVGGFVIAQEPVTAKYDGMPRSAIETGEVDSVLPPDKIGLEIKEYLENPQSNKISVSPEKTDGSSLSKIFKLLSKRTGTDFSNYKPSTICRRLEKRLNMLKINSVDDYLELVEKNPKELDEMFNMILIGVTSFFRDAEAFQALRVYVEKFLNEKTEKSNIRIWIPGTSTGEEAYSLAIMISEILAERTAHHNVQIFATDIDEKAISYARKGVYREEVVRELPKDIISKYFFQNGKTYELSKNIRSMVLFSKHDLTSNPPFLKLDLICCRNLLIYFGATLQQQIIPVFHYALNPDGYLFLGKSETVGQFSDLFATLDSKNKIYQKKTGSTIHAVKFTAFKPQKAGALSNLGSLPRKELTQKITLADVVRDTIFQTFENPYVIVNEQFDVVEIRGDVRLFMTFQQGSVQINLLKMVNHELQIELRAILMQASKERKSVKSTIKKFELFGNRYFVRMFAKPLVYNEFNEDLYMIVFETLDLNDVVGKSPNPSESELEKERLIELEQELAATKEHLQTYIEELETSNEELQSLNEELQSTNEELQSSSEELETSNEELQSTNEEVQIAYAELKTANEELERKERLLREQQANLTAMLNNDLQAFILVDLSYKILLFNEKARSIFASIYNRKIKVGDTIIDFIDSRIIETFLKDFKNVTLGAITHREISLTDVSGQDNWFSFNFTPVYNADDEIYAVSVGIMNITQLKNALTAISDKEKQLASVFNVVSVGLCVIDESGRIKEVNKHFKRLLGFEKEEIEGLTFTVVLPPEKRVEALNDLQNFFRTGNYEPGIIRMLSKNGDTLSVHVSAELLTQSDGKKFQILCVRDVTLKLKSLQNLNEMSDLARIGNWEVDLVKNIVNLSRVTLEIHDLPEDAKPDLEACINFYKEGENRERIRRLVNDAILRGIPFDDEFEFITAKGNTIWVRAKGKAEFVSGRCVRIFGVFQDITNEIVLREKISASEHKFAEAFEHSAKGMALFSDSFRFTKVNSTFCDLLGYGNKEFLGLSCEDLFFGDEYKIIKEQIALLIKKEKRNFSKEVRLRHKNNKEVWVLFSVSYMELFKSAELCFLIQVSDINEKRKLIAELNDSNFRFEKIAEATRDAIWDWDTEKNSILWSESYQKLFGYGKHNKPSLDFWKSKVHQDDRERVLQVMQSAVEKGDYRYQVQYRFQHADGRWLDVEDRAVILRRENGKAYRVIGAMADITEFKKRERQLMLFEAIVENAKDGIIVTEAEPILFPGPRIVYANDAVCKMTGFSKEELLGKTPRILQGMKTDRKVLDRINSALRAWDSIEVELINYKKNGEEFWNNFSVIPIADEKGWFTHWISVSRDVTEIRKNYVEKEQLVKELAKNNQELKQFSYITSHNMRSPLTNIMAILDLIDRNTITSAETLEWLDALRDSAENLNVTLNDLIQILIIKENSNISEEFIRFEDSLNRVTRSIDELIKKSGAKIITNFYPAKEVFFNKSYLDSIFLNFLTNSIKYAVPGRPPVINIFSQKQNNQVQLVVQDNGLGFDMKNVEGRIFGLYQTFHAHEDSKGIGLYLVHAQVTALGGTIDVSSEVNQGTKFTLTFKNP